MNTTTRTKRDTRPNKPANRSHACAADIIQNRKAPAPMPPPWELHVGLIKLAIIGPADHQWFSVSKPCYGGPVGTDREKDIAQRAVSILNREHNVDITITRPQIDAILQRATAERAAAGL